MPDEFASVTRNDALLDALADEIAASGPLTFERFMELALYHPALGYYRSGKRRIGERGDYVTSPYVSPLFGAIVGRQIAEVWERLGSPARFDLVEMGAGDGRLMRDILARAKRREPALATAIRPVLVEPDPVHREAQARTLAHLGATPRWVDDLSGLPMGGVAGCFLSNELVDSFPVRLLTVHGTRTRDVCVGFIDGSLVEADGPVADLELPPHLAALIGSMPDGARIEVNERARAWMAEVAARLGRGLVLTFDYGYAAAQLYAPWRTQGTLMAFYRHSVAPSPLAHPGEQDLTAHVDFTALAFTGHDHGLEPVGFTSQREFLTALGIHEAVSAPGLPLEETLARRRAVLALTDPGGLGRVRVFAQGKDVDGAGLTGFTGSPPPWELLLAGIEREGGVEA
jgi:SAM-dependent MidA family methyltransferase